MAVGLLRSKLPADLRAKVNVRSAGTLGIQGSHATEDAVVVMKELNIDISEHVSGGVTESLVADSNIILVMANEHTKYLQKKYPKRRDDIFLLRTFDRKSKPLGMESIPDPIGLSTEAYREIRDMLAEEITRVLPRLVRLIDDYYALAPAL